MRTAMVIAFRSELDRLVLVVANIRLLKIEGAPFRDMIANHVGSRTQDITPPKRME